MRLFNFNIGHPHKRIKENDSVPMRDRFVSCWARPPSVNTSEWLDMFSKSPRLAVVDRIAGDIADIKGRLFAVDQNGIETEITRHRFLDFMSNLNPLYEMTPAAVWRLHEIYLLLVGESFMVMDKDENGYPKEIWVVPPYWVKSVPYQGNPAYSIVSPDGMSISIPVDDMFVMKQLNPSSPFGRGVGIAESISDEIEIDEYAAKFQKRFFYNDATPPIVFLMPEAGKEQREAFMLDWNTQHRGLYNSHKAAALSGRVDIKELGNSNGKDLGFIESRIAMRNAVLEHFGVPREIMGITENSNRATADAAQYIYARNVLTPKLKMREEAINKQILPLFGENLIWRFDSVIPYDKEFDKSKAIEAYNAGLITRNEARYLIDMPYVEGGDIFKSPEIKQEGSTGRLAKSELPEKEEGMSRDVNINLSSQFRLEELAVNEDAKYFKEAIRECFLRQQKELSEKFDAISDISDILPPGEVHSTGVLSELPENELLHITAIMASAILNWNMQSLMLMEAFQPLWKKAYNDGISISEEIYDLRNAKSPEYISSEQIKGSEHIDNIERTSRSDIAKAIATGILAGYAFEKLKEFILSDVRSKSDERIEVIARHEALTALASGQYDKMKAAGVKAKTWHHTPQLNPRDGSHGPNHVILDGETVAVESVFSNGLRFPRDPVASAAETVNCKCYLTYKF